MARFLARAVKICPTSSKHAMTANLTNEEYAAYLRHTAVICNRSTRILSICIYATVSVLGKLSYVEK